MQTRSTTKLIFLLGGMSTIGPFTTDMYLPAFSAIATELGATVPEVSYSLSSYFAGICLGQLMHGLLIDRFGRKKPLLIFLSLFVITSIACSWSNSVTALVIYRFFQAIAASCGMVVGRAVVRDLFPPGEIAKVFSSIILVMGVAPIIAPTVGGYVVAALGWEAVFWTLAGIGLVVLFAVFVYLPESKGPDPSVSLRPLPALKNYASVLAHPYFTPFAIAAAMNTCGLFGYIAGSSYVYMELLNLSEQQFGWMFGLNAVCFITGSQINRLFLRFSTSHMIILRTVSTQLIVGVSLVLVVWTGMLTVITTLLLTGAYAICLGIIAPNAVALALRPFSHNAGVASATLGSLQMGAGALSSLLVGLLNDGTALSMAGVMTLATMIGLLSLSVGIRVLRRTGVQVGSY